MKSPVASASFALPAALWVLLAASTRVSLENLKSSISTMDSVTENSSEANEGPIFSRFFVSPQTDLSEWGSDGLLKDPVGVDTHRVPVPPSTFVRRLRTWRHLMSSRLDEMVARATLAEKTQWF